MTNSSSSMQMSCLFTQMTTYLEELVRPQPPEDAGLGGMTEKETEEEVLGYRMATCKVQAPGGERVGLNLVDDSEGQAERDLSTHWVDNILNWTVRDREDSFLDYDLGEIANRNFQDRHGICAEQEEIYTVWKEEEPV